MSTYHFSMAEIHGAKKQIEARTFLGMDVPQELKDIAGAEIATAEARTHKTNLDSYPLEQITAVYYTAHVEADGNVPGRHSMLSLGMSACALETKDGKFIPLDMTYPLHGFYTELKPVGEVFDGEVAEPMDRENLINSGADPEAEMNRLQEWVSTLSSAYGGFATPMFVGYPLVSAWGFVHWYLMTYAKKGSPFIERATVDIATLLTYKTNMPFGRPLYSRGIPKEIRLGKPDPSNSLGIARTYGGMFNNLINL